MNRRRAFTIVELMIVVMVIGILLSIAVPQWMRARETSRATTCLNNLKEIDNAKQRIAIEFKLAGGDTVTNAQLTPEFLKTQMPSCPSGGVYTIAPIDQQPSCTIHGMPIPGP